jgi:hypothetical protein
MVPFDVLQHIQYAVRGLSLQLVGLVVGFLVFFRVKAEDFD